MMTTMNESLLLTCNNALANEDAILTEDAIQYSIEDNIKAETNLKEGQIVNVEIRESNGSISPLSHEYPIDPTGKIKIPSLTSKIQARGNTISELGERISKYIISNKIIANPTVNVNIVKTKSISYSHVIKNGDTIFMRILEADGKINESSGKYPVYAAAAAADDGGGKVLIPGISFAIAARKKIFDLENEIEKLIVKRDFLKVPFVYISRFYSLL